MQVAALRVVCIRLNLQLGLGVLKHPVLRGIAPRLSGNTRGPRRCTCVQVVVSELVVGGHARKQGAYQHPPHGEIAFSGCVRVKKGMSRLFPHVASGASLVRLLR